ncbi:MAG TPA: CoA-transferase [Xanthomonadales bacterium]|nr:CoA-transferase [Xanthomonadales bacterium]
MADKVRTAAQVVGSIPDGSHIALGGFAIARNVNTVVHELIRQRKKDLTLSQCVMGMDTDLLVGAGLVSRLIVGGGSLDRFGLVNCVNRARESGGVIAIDATSLSISFAYLAGALGISFIPIKSMIGSEILARLEAGEAAERFQRMDCPFTGEPYLLLRAIQPDVALVHVQRADREGNCQIDGPRWENEEQAKAAHRVVVIAEELVATDVIRQRPERTIIPGHRVEAVIHQPFGAHPTAVYGCYDYDAAHLTEYVRHTKRSGGIEEYLERYILNSSDYDDYLHKSGGLKHLDTLKARPGLGY